MKGLKKTKKIICTDFSNGKKREFRVFKESKTKIHPYKETKVDTGYQRMQKLHKNTCIPKKKTKKNPLTKEDKKNNKKISSDRVANEHAIGKLKIFKIILIYHYIIKTISALLLLHNDEELQSIATNYYKIMHFIIYIHTLSSNFYY